MRTTGTQPAPHRQTEHSLWIPCITEGTGVGPTLIPVEYLPAPVTVLPDPLGGDADPAGDAIIVRQLAAVAAAQDALGAAAHAVRRAVELGGVTDLLRDLVARAVQGLRGALTKETDRT